MSGDRLAQIEDVPLADVEDIKQAFIEVLGYHHAYRVCGDEAGPDLGWAIRNFNEVSALARLDSGATEEDAS